MISRLPYRKICLTTTNVTFESRTTSLINTTFLSGDYIPFFTIAGIDHYDPVITATVPRQGGHYRGVGCNCQIGQNSLIAAP